jgi:hypothetical protein
MARLSLVSSIPNTCGTATAPRRRRRSHPGVLRPNSRRLFEDPRKDELSHLRNSLRPWFPLRPRARQSGQLVTQNAGTVEHRRVRLVVRVNPGPPALHRKRNVGATRRSWRDFYAFRSLRTGERARGPRNEHSNTADRRRKPGRQVGSPGGGRWTSPARDGTKFY